MEILENWEEYDSDWPMETSLDGCVKIMIIIIQVGRWEGGKVYCMRKLLNYCVEQNRNSS